MVLSSLNSLDEKFDVGSKIDEADGYILLRLANLSNEISVATLQGGTGKNTSCGTSLELFAGFVAKCIEPTPAILIVKRDSSCHFLDILRRMIVVSLNIWKIKGFGEEGSNRALSTSCRTSDYPDVTDGGCRPMDRRADGCSVGKSGGKVQAQGIGAWERDLNRRSERVAVHFDYFNDGKTVAKE